MIGSDKFLHRPKIGVFDSGIGGFSVLTELFVVLPEADYFYFSDDAYAPFGPKTDEFITQRAFVITDELQKKGAELIVVACNTATAASIDALRSHFPKLIFVGVEPYLNAYYKETSPSKMAVITTESTGKSERFKRLKERLDPFKLIDHYSLKNLARHIEELYYNKISNKDFDNNLEADLADLKKHHYTHVILGCTHYPLIKQKIEHALQTKTLSPCPYVAGRVKELLVNVTSSQQVFSDTFDFYSSTKPAWSRKSRHDFLGPFN